MLLVYLCAKHSHPNRGTASFCILRCERRPGHAEGKCKPSESSIPVSSQLLLLSAGMRLWLSSNSILATLCDSTRFKFCLHLLFWGLCAHAIPPVWRPKCVTKNEFTSQEPLSSLPLSLHCLGDNFRSPFETSSSLRLPGHNVQTAAPNVPGS